MWAWFLSAGQATLWLSAGVYSTKTLINCICHSQEQNKRKKHPIAQSCQQCPAFYIITMFIGFLFSQWQKSHLPTAALQPSSKISCETYWGLDPPLPIKLQFKKIYPSLSTSQAQLYTTQKTIFFLLRLFSCFCFFLVLLSTMMIEVKCFVFESTWYLVSLLLLAFYIAIYFSCIHMIDSNVSERTIPLQTITDDKDICWFSRYLVFACNNVV